MRGANDGLLREVGERLLNRNRSRKKIKMQVFSCQLATTVNEPDSLTKVLQLTAGLSFDTSPPHHTNTLREV